MVTIWRYLIGSYLKTFFISIIAFIALVLVSRLEEIAYFISLKAPVITVLLFISYQIPYILPIAGGITCLFAAFTLFYRLSATQELTTLRFSGLSLSFIVIPLLILGALFSCASFYLISECATTSHLKTRKMVYDLTYINPLLILSHANIPKLKTTYIQMTATHQGGKNLFIAFFNKSTNCINYILAKNIEIEEEKLIGKNLSFILSSPKNNALIIENQDCIKSSAKDFASLMTSSKGWKIANDHLNLRLLRLSKQEYKQAKKASILPEDEKEYRKKIQKCDAELMRRISLALAPFTFTFMGIALGMHISRHQSKKRIILTTFLTISALISFCIAKGMSHLFYLTTTLFFLPHIIIILISWHALYRIRRGIE